MRVHAVFPGPIDTDMIRAMDMPRTAAADVARAMSSTPAVSPSRITPDPMSVEVFGTFVKDPRAVEKKFAG